MFAAWVLAPDFTGFELNEPTLVRTIVTDSIVAFITTEGAAAANRSVEFACGLLAIGGQSQPGDPPPIMGACDQPGLDWVWYNRKLIGNANGGAGTTVSVVSNGLGEILDVKSKRRLKRGDGLAFYAQALTLGTNTSIQFGVTLRCLVIDH